MITLLLSSLPALADPFFAWGDHTAAGTVAANPYVFVWPDGSVGVRAYSALGLTDRWDVLVGAGSYGLGDAFGEVGFLDVIPRWALSDSGETVLALRVGYEGAFGIGPELHMVQRPNDRWSAWTNLALSFAPTDPSYSYWGIVLGVDLALTDTWFVAVESDNYLSVFAPRDEHELDVIPAVGAWVTDSTGVSVGVMLPVGREEAPGVGAWLWTERARPERR